MVSRVNDVNTGLNRGNVQRKSAPPMSKSESMRDRLLWGLIGTGGIASDFVESLGRSNRCRVINVAGSSPAKARDFANRWSLPTPSSSLDELLADKSVEAVYIATPHPSHEAQAIACIEAGKHVLCEKPMTVDAAGTERVIEAARRRGVFLMEAFMYRCHPLMAAVIARVREGAIGQLQHVRADFGFTVPRNPSGRLFAPELGGGGILDVGGYPISFCRLMAGLAEGKPFAEPTSLQATAVLGPTGVDEHAAALLTFASGLTAQATCAVRYGVGTQTVVFGEEGKIFLPDPWIPGGRRQALESSFTIVHDGKEPETVTIKTERPTYAIEAELAADTIPNTEAPWPAMSWADSLGNMKVLDAWRAAIAR
jgi:predicted dehydrogenase